MNKKTPYDLDRSINILDIHKQFEGGLRTVDTSDDSGTIFLKESENFSLSKHAFIKKRYGTYINEKFKFNEKPFLDVIQGYFEYVDEDGDVHKIIFVNGIPYIKNPKGENPNVFDKTIVYNTEEGFEYPDPEEVFTETNWDISTLAKSLLTVSLNLATISFFMIPNFFSLGYSKASAFLEYVLEYFYKSKGTTKAKATLDFLEILNKALEGKSKANALAKIIWTALDNYEFEGNIKSEAILKLMWSATDNYEFEGNIKSKVKAKLLYETAKLVLHEFEGKLISETEASMNYIYLLNYILEGKLISKTQAKLLYEVTQFLVHEFEGLGKTKTEASLETLTDRPVDWVDGGTFLTAQNTCNNENDVNNTREAGTSITYTWVTIGSYTPDPNQDESTGGTCNSAGDVGGTRTQCFQDFETGLWECQVQECTEVTTTQYEICKVKGL